jgi:hypothetical protein
MNRQEIDLLLADFGVDEFEMHRSTWSSTCWRSLLVCAAIICQHRQASDRLTWWRIWALPA